MPVHAPFHQPEIIADIIKREKLDVVNEPISKDVNMLAKVCRLCVKFDPKKHNLGERLCLA